MSKYLKERYGDTVETEFYDFADEATRGQQSEMAATVQANRWSLPLVTIDGKLEFSGYIDHRAIVKSIEQKRGSAA